MESKRMGKKDRRKESEKRKEKIWEKQRRGVRIEIEATQSHCLHSIFPVQANRNKKISHFCELLFDGQIFVMPARGCSLRKEILSAFMSRWQRVTTLHFGTLNEKCNEYFNSYSKWLRANIWTMDPYSISFCWLFTRAHHLCTIRKINRCY